MKKIVAFIVLAIITANVYSQDASIDFSSSPALGGNVFPSGLHYFNANQVFTIYASSAADYHFVRWESTGSVEFLTPLNDPNGMIKTHYGDSTIVAVFEGDTTDVTLTLAVSPGAGGTTAPAVGSHQIETGQSQAIEATAASGYSFSYWTVTGEATIADPAQRNTSVICNGNATVTANFIATQTLRLTMAVDPDSMGSTTPSVGEHDVAKNVAHAVSVQAVSGYQFDHWHGTGNISIDDPNSPSTTVTLRSNATLTAVLLQEAEKATVKMEVSPDSSGYTSPAVGDIQVNIGEPVSIHAYANSGYTFVRWKATGPIQLGDQKDPDTYMKVVNSSSDNKIVTAVFEASTTGATLTIAVDPANGGSTNPGVGDHSVEINRPYEVSAFPVEGYHFKNWTIDGNGVVSNTNLVTTWVTLAGDATLIANFAADSEDVSLTVAASPAGGGNVNPGIGVYTVQSGQPVTLTAHPAIGYHFVNWTLTGDAWLSNSNLVQTTVTPFGDTTITANFAANTTPASLTISASPEVGGVTNPGSGTYTYNAGQTIKVSAAVADGYYFTGWVGSGSIDISEPGLIDTPVLINGDGVLTATFEKSTTDVVVTLDASPATAGSTNPGTGTYTLHSGQAVKIKAKPASGYYFKEWAVVGNIRVAEPNQVETVMTPTGNGSVTAVFESSSSAVVLTVNVSPENTGWTCPSGSTVVNANQYYKLKAIPKRGYHFVRWTTAGSIVVTDKKLSVTYAKLTGAATATAVFAANAHPATLTFGVSPAGSGYTYPCPGSHSYYIGQTKKIYAIPKKGYHFVRWSVSGAANVLEPQLVRAYITIFGDATVTAKFAANTEDVKLTMASSPEAGGTTFPVAGTYTINKYQPYFIKARPNSGYYFYRWIVKGKAHIADRKLVETSVTLLGDATVTAVYREVTETVNLTMKVSPDEGGGVSPGSGVHSVTAGRTYKIEAIPASGYYFKSWKVDGPAQIGDVRVNRTTIVLRDDTTVTANFASSTTPVTMTMSALPAETGQTNPGQGSYSVSAGETIHIEAEPLAGYHFVKWSITGDATLSEAQLLKSTVTLNGDATVTANFAANSQEITVVVLSLPLNGGSTNPGTGIYNYYAGQTVEMTATPAEGYHFIGWVGIGKVDVLEPELIRTYVQLNGSGSVIARFAKNSTNVLLSIVSLPLNGGSTNPGNGLHLVNKYEPFEIEAQPADGYYFKGWLATGNVDLASTTTTKTVATLDGNGGVIAVFGQAASTAVLSVSLKPNGAGVTSPTGSQTVNTNQYYKITAVADSGYHFVNWTTSGDISITNDDLREAYVILTGDGAAVANFAESTISAAVTFAVSPDDTGYTNPGEGTHSYNVGQTIEIQASPKDGYHFIEWVVAGNAEVGNFDLSKTYLEINGDATVTAKFGENTTEATITMAVKGEGETVPATGSYDVYTGETRKIMAVPADNYHFVNWTVSGKATILNPYLISSYIEVEGDATVTANFAPNTSAVNMTMAVFPEGAGTVDPEIGTHEVNRLQPYKITAVPAENYYFSHWDTEGEGIVADIKLLQTVIVLYGDATVTAVFKSVTEQTVLTMVASPEGSGTTDPAVGEHTVNIGQTYEIEASAASGYHFVSWQARGAAQISNIHINKTTIVLGGVATVTASFAADTEPVTLTMESSPEDGGYTNPGTGSYTVNAGETLKIEAIPANGYHFVQWSLIGSGEIANDKSFRTTAVIERDSTIIAHFAENRGSAVVNVDTLPADGGGTTPGTGSYEVYIGNIYKIEAVPAEGFHFVRWETTGNMIIETPKSSDTSVVALGDSDLTAEFAKNEAMATLTMGVTPENAGIINPAVGEHSVAVNQSVGIEAKPLAGYYFVQWLVVGSAEIDNPDSAATFATLVGDATVIAEFAKMNVEATVVMGSSPANAGTTSPASGDYQVKVHDRFTIIATPASGYQFIKWSTTGNITIDDARSSVAIATVNGNGQVTAEFVEESEGVLLTLLVENNDGGFVIPWKPTYVKQGEAVQIYEVPFDGFVFVDWTLNSGEAFITYSEETGTTVTCQTDTTLTAKYQPVVKPRKTRLTVHYKRKNMIDKEEKPDDTITLRNAGMTLKSLDPENDKVEIIAANQRFELNSESGEFVETHNGYQYDSFDKTIRLILNFNKETWTFTVKKDLLDNPDFENGIGAVLIVNSELSGANYQVNQNSKWKYIAKQNGAGEELVKNGVNTFDITKANGSYVSTRKRQLNVNVSKGTIALADGYTFDPENDSVLIYIDNVFFPIVPGSFVMKKSGIYVYNDKNRNSKMRLDFNKGTWTLNLRHNSSFKEISYKDGLDIYLVIGNAEAGIRLNINFKNTFKF